MCTTDGFNNLTTSTVDRISSLDTTGIVGVERTRVGNGIEVWVGSLTKVLSGVEYSITAGLGKLFTKFWDEVIGSDCIGSSTRISNSSCVLQPASKTISKIQRLTA